MIDGEFNFTPQNRVIYGIDGEPIVWIEKVDKDWDTGEISAIIEENETAARMIADALLYEDTRNNEVGM